MRSYESWIVLGDRAIPAEAAAVDALVDKKGNRLPVMAVAEVQASREGGRLVRLVLEAEDPARGIRQGDIAAVNVAALVEQTLGAWTRMIGPDGELDLSGSPADGVKVAGRIARKKGPGTAGFAQEVADVYRANFDTGPAKAVAERFQVSARTAANYIREARDLGLLPPTTKGRKRA